MGNIFKAFITLLLLGVSGYLFLYGLIAFVLTGLREYILPSFVLLVSLLIYLLILLWNHPWLAKKHRYFLIPIFLLALYLGGRSAYDFYHYSIPTVTDDVNENRYMPFRSDSLVARLDRPASFQIIDNLPRIDCATALYPLGSAFVEATYPQGEYSPYADSSLVRSSKTPPAYERLIKGSVDVIVVAAPSDKQKQEAHDNGVRFTLTPIGKEGFVFFVNIKNPVENLTVEQIQGIYSGKITNWKELGGEDELILPFQRAEDSGSQSALLRLMEGQRLMEARTMTVSDMGEIITKTADYKNYKNAIGFSFRFYATQMVKNKEIKLLKINGIYPDESAIRDNTYPISSYFYAVTTDKSYENPHMKKFIDWILSKEGQLLVERTGYTPLR